LFVEVNKYYKLREMKVRINTDFVVTVYEKHYTSKLLASWWKEDRKLIKRTTRWYGTTNMRETYMYLMALIFRLCGGKYFSRVSETWIPLAYTVVILGRIFNS